MSPRKADGKRRDEDEGEAPAGPDPATDEEGQESGAGDDGVESTADAADAGDAADDHDPDADDAANVHDPDADDAANDHDPDAGDEPEDDAVHTADRGDAVAAASGAGPGGQEGRKGGRRSDGFTRAAGAGEKDDAGLRGLDQSGAQEAISEALSRKAVRAGIVKVPQFAPPVMERPEALKQEEERRQRIEERERRRRARVLAELEDEEQRQHFLEEWAVEDGLHYKAGPNDREIEIYPIREPYTYVQIVRNERSHEMLYHVIEPMLDREERILLQFIEETLVDVLDLKPGDLHGAEVRSYIEKKFNEVLRDYSIVLGEVEMEEEIPEELLAEAQEAQDAVQAAKRGAQGEGEEEMDPKDIKQRQKEAAGQQRDVQKRLKAKKRELEKEAKAAAKQAKKEKAEAKKQAEKEEAEAKKAAKKQQAAAQVEKRRNAKAEKRGKTAGDAEGFTGETSDAEGVEAEGVEADGAPVAGDVGADGVSGAEDGAVAPDEASEGEEGLTEEEGEEGLAEDEDEAAALEEEKIFPQDPAEASRDRLLYYVMRDFIGEGPLDVLMRDPMIEDISCDGPHVPIFVYHRKYEALTTTIKFRDDEALDSFVIRLAQRAGKHVSIAEPILDATMADGSRIQATLAHEVSAFGSTFTIRKFKEVPFTPIDLVRFGTMAPDMLAYLWMVIEHHMSAIYAGGTASGKTTAINAIMLFIPPQNKVVTIEDTREIQIPQPNWIAGVTRGGFGPRDDHGRQAGEIDMFQLLKNALRQRPEYIIVGEVRGAEAYSLFQAMATGHAAYGTMHADSVDAVIHRLESDPINIPRSLLEALDVVAVQVQTRVEGKRVRRTKQITEIVGLDPNTREILTNEVFHWVPGSDSFEYSGVSYALERIAAETGAEPAAVTEELNDRARLIQALLDHGFTKYEIVAHIITTYYKNKERVLAALAADDWDGLVAEAQRANSEAPPEPVDLAAIATPPAPSPESGAADEETGAGDGEAGGEAGDASPVEGDADESPDADADPAADAGDKAALEEE